MSFKLLRQLLCCSSRHGGSLITVLIDVNYRTGWKESIPIDYIQRKMMSNEHHKTG